MRTVRTTNLLRLATFTAAIIPLCLSAAVSAATVNASPGARVSFTFDDGLASALTKAAPTLAKYGYTGTDFVITGCVGKTGIGNGCPADPDANYMTWDQITQLQNQSGWEIGSHTATHPQLATDKLTDAQLETELGGSKHTLVDHGFNPISLATPYGDYDAHTLSVIAKYYANQRGFWDLGGNTWPYSDYLVRVRQVQVGVSPATVQNYINQAITNKQWLVLVFHDIQDQPSSNPDDYQYSTANLDKIAAYVKSKNVPVVRYGQGTVSSTTNLFSNGTFDNGLLTGWSTDNPAAVTADSNNHGSYPSPAKSVSLTASTKDVHLFSEKVPVSSTTQYLFKSYLDIDKLTSGEVGYYVDEYDANGTWISGQWKTAEKTAFTEEINIAYKPSSVNVKQASLQVYVSANSGIHAYVDSFQMLPLN